MRIGKFGEKNNLSIDTIRHYMDLGLIMPEKKGGQYFFDGRCQSALDTILELKGMGFSLNEVKMIFFYQNFGKFVDFENNIYYQSLFMDKYASVEREIKELEKTKEKLKAKINQLSEQHDDQAQAMGIELNVMEKLRCTKCKGKLILQDARISRNQITDGRLACDCGAEYWIEEGILIAGGALYPGEGPMLHGEDHIQEYIHATATAYLENLFKGVERAKRKFEQVDLRGKVLLEFGTGFGFFLRAVYQSLPEDCLYIAVDHNLERQRFLKRLLERANLRKNVLFVCADFLDIPLRDCSVDVVIDVAGTSNYSFEHEAFLLSETGHLFKEDCYLLGTYISFKNFSSKGKIEARFRHNFMEGAIKERLESLEFSAIDERTSGYVEKGGKYEDFFVPGEKVYSYCFFGKR